MKLDLCLTRQAPLGGTEVVSARVEYKNTSDLEYMGIHELNGGTFAMGSNNEGFVIQLARITFSNDDYLHDIDKNTVAQVNKAKVFFGIDQ